MTQCLLMFFFLIGGDRVLRRLLRSVCCWCWWAAAEHQLPDDICVERSIDSLVVVDQGDELCSYKCEFSLDSSQAGRYLFKSGLRFRITDERPQVLLHTILCTEIKRMIWKILYGHISGFIIISILE